MLLRNNGFSCGCVEKINYIFTVNYEANKNKTTANHVLSKDLF